MRNSRNVGLRAPVWLKISSSTLPQVKIIYKNFLTIVLKEYSRPGHHYPYEKLSKSPSSDLLFLVPEIHTIIERCSFGAFEQEFLKILLSPVEHKTSVNGAILSRLKSQCVFHFGKNTKIAMKDYVHEIEKHVTLPLDISDRQFFINFFIEEITDFGSQEYDKFSHRFVNEESFKLVQLALFLKLLSDVAFSTSTSKSSYAKLKFLIKTSYSSQLKMGVVINSSTKKTKKSRKPFRIRSKTFFLTYNQVPCISPTDIKKYFLETLINQLKFLSVDHASPTKYLICLKRNAVDGDDVHIYLEYAQKLESRNTSHFDVDLSEHFSANKKILCKGNYVSARYKQRVLNYIMKDQIRLDDVLVNFELPLVNKIDFGKLGDGRFNILR
jgi:hypothetical protein